MKDDVHQLIEIALNLLFTFLYQPIQINSPVRQVNAVRIFGDPLTFKT